MSTTVARLEAILGADTSGFDKAMSKSEGRLHGVRTAAGLAGAAIATGLGVVAKVGFDELKDAQKVTAQTNAVLKSTGGIAHVSAKQIDEMATSLLNKTGIDDETVKSGENLLLTFKNIRNEAGRGNDMFNQATKATLDLSVAFGKSVPQAAVLVGKALNDPIKGLTALSRVGVTFTQQQKDQIKALVASGDRMKAQKIIMRELNSETGGSAAAAGKTLQGQLNITKETFKNLAAQIVSAVLPAVTDFAKIVSRATTFLSEHEKVAKILFVGLGLLAGVLFTISASMKIAAAATKVYAAAQWLLNAAMSANPISLIIIALIALGVAIVVAWKKSETFRDIVIGTWNAIKAAASAVFGAIKATIFAVWDAIKAITHAVWEGILFYFKNFTLPGLILSHWNTIKEFTAKAWDFVRDTIVGIVRGISGTVSNIIGDIVGFFRHFPGRIGDAISAGAKAIKEAVSGLFGKVIGWVKDVLGIGSPSAVFHSIGQNVVKGFVNGIGSMAGVLKNAVVGMVKSLPGKVLGAVTGEIESAPGEHSVGSAEKYLVPWAQQEGITVTSIAGGKHAKGSYHYQHRAIDVDGGYAKNRDFFADSINHFGAKNITELFFDPMGYYIKNGKRIKGAIGGHGDHVHIALAKGGIVRKRMLAEIGEDGPEAVIPLAPHRQKDAAKVLSQILPQSWQDSYLGFMKRIWPFASKYLPGAGGMPRTVFTTGLDALFAGTDFTPNAGGRVPGPGKRTVFWPQWANLMNGKGLDAMRMMLIHEWAHEFQNIGETTGIRLGEGGAQAFALEMAPRIFSEAGIPFNKPSQAGDPYWPYVQYVRRTKGLDWILRGQFGGPSAMRQLKSAVFDKGGWLQPGLTLAANNTGRPEPVGGGGNVTINYNGTIIHEREAEQRIVDLLTRAQRRGPLGLSGGFA